MNYKIPKNLLSKGTSNAKNKQKTIIILIFYTWHHTTKNSKKNKYLP